MAATGLPWWEPSRFDARRAALRRRSAMTRTLRRFFDQRGYTEVETPALQVSPGLEPHLSAFETFALTPAGDRFPLYLHTSPEYAMKKLLAAGMERIWQLARAFRNGERSATHHPEFAMLEWYRAGAGWRDIAEETVELIRDLVGSEVSWQGKTCNLSQPWHFLTVETAFQKHAGIDLRDASGDYRAPDVAGLRRAAAGIGIRTATSDSWEDVYFRIFLECIEPVLGTDRPVILHSYPISMAALAKPDPVDPLLAERFEIYLCGLELANGFGELTDAAEQGQRFEDDLARRRELGHAIYPRDEDFLRALASGLPECAGIALGFDRLVMLATGSSSIEDVLWAPVVDGGVRYPTESG